MRLTFILALGLLFASNINAQAAEAAISKETAVMVKSLDLSPEQTTKVQTVYATFQKKQSVVKFSSKDQKVVGAKLDELDASFAEKLAEILTPDQFSKWQSLQNQSKG